MAQVIDYSGGVPDASRIKEAGFVGVVRYISPPRQPWMVGKPLKKDEVDSLKANGVEIAVVWQYGGASNPDSMRGYEGGRQDALDADKQLNAIGLSGLPVFFAVDFNITLDQWNNTAVNYFKGVNSVLGRERTGIYGHSRVCSWSVEDGVVGSVGDKFFCWQTIAWSKGERAPEAVLYQRVSNVTGPDGVQVDISDVLNDNWGQKPLTRPLPQQEGTSVTLQKRPGWSGDPLWLADALRAFGVKVVEDPGWQDWGNGDFLDLWGVIIHHTGGNNTPSSLIRYGHSALRGLLSQINLKRDGTAVIVGAGYAYHAGVGSWPGLPTNNANPHTIGIEADSDGQTPWPEEMLDAYYRCCAAICWVLDKPASFVIGHKEWGAIQGKWDPGLIDMDLFRQHVQYYIDNPPFKEILMTDFDKIENLYPSRVPDSDVQMRPLDALYNIDAHSFVSRVNTVKVIDMLNQQNAKIDSLTDMVKSILDKSN